MASIKSTFALLVVLQTLIIFRVTSGNDNIFPVEEITKDVFEEKFDAGDLLLVNFVGPGCKNCKDFMPIFNKVNGELKKMNAGISAVVVNNKDVVRRFDFQKLPSLVLFRKNIPILYEDHHEVEEIMVWISENKKVNGRTLKDEDFEHLTQASTGSTTGDWLVQFCVPERPQCESILAIWETVAYRLKGKINVATVDISKNPALAKRFKVGVDRTPYVLFLKDGNVYNMHLRLVIGPAAQLHQFLTSDYKKSKFSFVPREETRFDELTETIAEQIKVVQSKVPSGTFVFVLGGLLILSAILFRIFGRKSSTTDMGLGGPKKGV